MIPNQLADHARMINNQIRKHGTYGGCTNTREAINNLSNFEVLALVLNIDEYDLEERLDEIV